MAPVKANFKTLLPYILTISLITLFFILWFKIPYSIQTDAAHQIKSIQQWLTGTASLPNSLVVPDPSDLSKDIQIWVAWWPPGIPLVFTPLIAAGLSLGLATRLTSYLLILVGCCGWVKVAELFRISWLTKIVFALTLPLYAIGSATYAISALNAGDVIPFAVMPWLAAYTIYLSLKLEKREFIEQKHFFHLFLISFLLGFIYWLKYSAFLVSCGLFLFLIFTYLKYQGLSVKRFLSVAYLSITFLVPFLGLSVLNRTLSNSGIAVQQYESAAYDSFGVQGLEILFTLLGTLGLAMFQGGDWFKSLVSDSGLLHTLNFADANQEREAKSLLLGIPSTFLTVWLLWRTRHLYTKQILLFCLCITVIPMLGLLYLGIKVQYNFLADPIARYSSAFIIPLEILFISSCFYLIFNSDQLQELSHENGSKIPVKLIGALIFLVVFIFPNGFILERFAHYYPPRLNASSAYITTKNQLFQPTLSNRNPRKIVNQINALITSPKDVLVLEIPDYPSYAESWLELNHRTLPLGLNGPLGILADKASQGLKTSQDLRVILVAAEANFKTQQEFERLAGRFPQATQWTGVKVPAHSKVSIWFSDIKVSG